MNDIIQKTHEVSFRKKLLFISLVIFLCGCVVYVPGIDQIGLYRDDWNNYWNALNHGAGFLKEHYAADRPLDGYLLWVFYRIFGTNNLVYLIWNLICRIIGSCAIAGTLLMVFPDQIILALSAGLLSVFFPGFLQQIEGISYVPHQTAMLSFILSLFLTAAAMKKEGRKKTLLIAVSGFLSLVCFGLMEYYIGMEIIRFVLLFAFTDKSNNTIKDRLGKTVVQYLPYLVPLVCFLIWRIWIFDAERTGTSVTDDIITPLLQQPFQEITDFFVRYVKNIWKLLVGCWTIPVQNLLNGADIKSFTFSAIKPLIVSVITAVSFILLHNRFLNNTAENGDLTAVELFGAGIIIGAISIIPLVFSKHDINFTQSLDRFSWVGMVGSIIFVIGLCTFISPRRLRYAVIVFCVFISAFVQDRNKTVYIGQWQSTLDYWQQLMWRAPMIKEGTTIVSGGTLLAEEDYDIFIPANFIYYPKSAEYPQIAAEVLNSETIKDIKLGSYRERETRKIIVIKDYTKLLAITKPSDSSCLRVINGSAPVYSQSEWTKIPEIGKFSQIDRIISDPEKIPDIPFFLGSEQEHTWCYYYEKMELALQMNDVETAVILADEASENGYYPMDTVELLPVVTSYILAGRIEDARIAGNPLLENEYMKRESCKYYKDLQQLSDDFDEAIKLFCE